MKHVIIGAGVAGITAAKTIKELDRDAKVVVIGDELFLPYKRYLLTEFLCDSIKRDELLFFSVEKLRELGIKLRKGEFAKAIDPSEKVIKLHHNEVMHYDKLLIATGGRPGLGIVLRQYKKHIHFYYSLYDTLILKEKLPEIQKCIVFGDGVSCLDLICMLHNLGKQVTYITKGERATFALEEDDFEGDLHEFLKKKGIKIITEDQIVSIEESDHGYKIETIQQKMLTTDIVFAWDNYKPNISCIDGSEIEKKLGILVNTRLETSEKDNYAAGDCIEIYHPCIKGYWINFGLPNALEQGVIAGKNMSGQDEEYKIQEAIAFNLMGKSLQARWWK
ncbi:MAG: Rubredoxin-NAD(+) reductase [Candidatus Scalindua arabica]|uniref:Rubredoxin-NAD(+) reductase n=1 Tax=Candidatus Scalindua arabica TaxID=1127984 RepID=A0A942A435_9BACT|nr:Rubredoxin-NAD(+) reductase [Candidatus Scalindua arabica]